MNPSLELRAHAPCLMCAKAVVNSGASALFYADPYTYPEGVAVLEGAGIPTQNSQT